MRYDLLSPRPKKDGSKHWHRVGAAFPRDDGTFAIEFNSMPLPDAEGKVFVLMSPHKPREGAQTASGDRPVTDTRQGAAPPADDEVPF